eukprot:COSAG03_NODE_11988_length_567_cov_0.747863_2_plen_95_part_01
MCPAQPLSRILPCGDRVFSGRLAVAVNYCAEAREDLCWVAIMFQQRPNIRLHHVSRVPEHQRELSHCFDVFRVSDWQVLDDLEPTQDVAWFDEEH